MASHCNSFTGLPWNIKMSSKTTKQLHVSWLVSIFFSHNVFFLIVDSLTELEENGSPCHIHSCPLYCRCDLWGSCRHTIGMWFIQTNDYLISPIKCLTFPEAANEGLGNEILWFWWVVLSLICVSITKIAICPAIFTKKRFEQTTIWN